LNLVNLNPFPPSIRGLLKIHKTGKPIQPIINWTQAPVYKIAKKLVKLINTLLPLPYTFNVKNSAQLTEDIHEIPINNGLKLASFNIPNMYTNIPTQQLPDIITYLCKQNYTDHSTQTEILKLCDRVLKQNYFKYQDTFYTQTQGLAMGAPTSSILSEIFLQHLEHTKIYNILRQHNIVGYFRYIDDILAVYDADDNNIQTVLQLFNNISPTLTFTTEHEDNNSINFLDSPFSSTSNSPSVYTKNQLPQTSSFLKILITPLNKKQQPSDTSQTEY
jgi:hypothetical protein